MSNSLPVELRERAVLAYEAGEGTYEELAALFRIGESTLGRWVRRKKKTGSVAPSRPGGGNFSHVDIGALEQTVAAQPDMTSYELTAAYNRHVSREHRAHRSSIQRALARAGYVFKKNARVRRRSRGQR